ncbi:retrovirus-related pol polyprotein from transposon TNT 1-94 [Tanacetum coccineum]
MVERSKLDEDLNGTLVDPTRYRGMVGSLMYLTASHSDLVFAVYMCARYLAKPTEKHLTAVKQVANIQGKVHRILWMRSQLTDYGFVYNKIPLYCDSQSAIALSCNTVQHSRKKTVLSDTILSRNKFKMGLLNSTLSRLLISWRIYSLKHLHENASNFWSSA